jgi:aryl-alcohol dehydrogenase-like predicted oxidoreductase
MARIPASPETSRSMLTIERCLETENFPKNIELVNKLKVVADKKNCTPGQLSLAWLMAQGDDIIPIPGTKRLKYLKENMGALNVKLTDEENKEIREAIDKTEIHGDRYQPGYASNLYVDTVPLGGE